MNDSPPDPREHAGPFGFTRREVIALTVVMALSVTVIGYSEWRDRRNQTPGWVIEDVLINTETATSQWDSVPSYPRDTLAASSPRRVASPPSDLINVNTADVRALARLPGIGPELARRMIEERSTNGLFVNLTDLQRVRGIGPRKAAMLSGWVVFDTVVVDAEDAK